jgi:trafficking protein particle complex subunit 3
MPTSKSG